MYRWVISRKYTASADRAMPSPMQKVSSSARGTGVSSRVKDRRQPVNTMTMRMATRLKLMVTKLEQTREKGKIYLGMYTLRIKGPFTITEYMDALVLSLKKVQRVWPQIRYRG